MELYLLKLRGGWMGDTDCAPRGTWVRAGAVIRFRAWDVKASSLSPAPPPSAGSPPLHPLDDLPGSFQEWEVQPANEAERQILVRWLDELGGAPPSHSGGFVQVRPQGISDRFLEVRLRATSALAIRPASPTVPPIVIRVRIEREWPPETSTP